MIWLRYALSGSFVIALAAGLVLMILAETRKLSGQPRGAASFLVRPAPWFGCAGLLLGAVVILTILFPVNG